MDQGIANRSKTGIQHRVVGSKKIDPAVEISRGAAFDAAVLQNIGSRHRGIAAQRGEDPLVAGLTGTPRNGLHRSFRIGVPPDRLSTTKSPIGPLTSGVKASVFILVLPGTLRAEKRNWESGLFAMPRPEIPLRASPARFSLIGRVEATKAWVFTWEPLWKIIPFWLRI